MTTPPDHIERAFGQIVSDWKLAWSSGNLQAAERYFAAANALEAAYPDQVAAWRRAHGGQA